MIVILREFVELNSGKILNVKEITCSLILVLFVLL